MLCCSPLRPNKKIKESLQQNNGPALKTETFFPPHANFILSSALVENPILVYMEFDEDSNVFVLITGDLLVSCWF